LDDQSKPVSRPWRRFLRFSVRGMIVVVLVIGGWLGWAVRNARMQREAVDAIQADGGEVIYDWEGPGPRSNVINKPWWAPQWLVEIVGIDYFGHITSVWISGPVSDAQLAHIANLRGLESLALISARLTDAGWAGLSGLSSLQSLSLSESAVSDDELLQLGGLNGLVDLDLVGTNITDAGLAHLKALKDLTTLSLERTRVTDAGLEHLTGLTNLQDVSLRETRVTDAGVQELRKAIPKARIIRMIRLE
jgi:internalin A